MANQQVSIGGNEDIYQYDDAVHTDGPFRVTENASSGNVLVSDGNGNLTSQSLTGAGGVITAGLTTNYIPKNTSADAFTLADSSIIDTGSAIGVNIASPDGYVHIHRATAGTVTASTLADSLIIEHSGNSGLSILTPDASVGRLMFGSPTAPRGTEIFWQHSATRMGFQTRVVGGEIRFRTSIGSTSSHDTLLLTTDQQVQTYKGRIKGTTRLTGNTTLGTSHHVVMCDTDGGAFTVTLPAGVDGQEYRIANTGSSGNAVTVTPDGAELLIGANSSLTLDDGEVLVIVYETTEGWW